jgi:hypothetical protein
MRLRADAPAQLTYCLNIHRGESWTETLAALRGPALSVARRVAPDQGFGLGLRLSARAAEELAEPGPLQDLCEFLARQNLSVFTINGFPYGRFHGAPVKARVYEPDWQPRRTGKAIPVYWLTCWPVCLPEGQDGSISTVPVGFAPALARPSAVDAAVARLLNTVRHLARVEAETGREIHVGLEPEPSCHLERSEEFVAFYQRLLAAAGPGEEFLVRRHLGVCFDTCHVALAFESLAEAWDRYVAAGIRISKVQLSAALQTSADEEARIALRAFVEPTYLHQVRVRRRDGTVAAWLDLPEALSAWPSDAEQVRVHFHVPLFWSAAGPLGPPPCPPWTRISGSGPAAAPAPISRWRLTLLRYYPRRCSAGMWSLA